MEDALWKALSSCMGAMTDHVLVRVSSFSTADKNPSSVSFNPPAKNPKQELVFLRDNNQSLLGPCESTAYRFHQLHTVPH